MGGGGEAREKKKKKKKTHNPGGQSWLRRTNNNSTPVPIILPSSNAKNSEKSPESGLPKPVKSFVSKNTTAITAKMRSDRGEMLMGDTYY